MRTKVAAYLGAGLIVGVVAVTLILGMTSGAAADECSAVGAYTFTLPSDAGFLFLSADGTARMDLTGHMLSSVGVSSGPVLRGTYRTFATDSGCFFEMRFSTPPPPAHTDTLAGVVAFEGRLLMFMASTSPGFVASGLALRNDALTGR